MPKDNGLDRDDKFEAEQDLRSIIEAAAVKSDPKRLRRAMKIAREQQKALKEVSRDG